MPAPLPAPGAVQVKIAYAVEGRGVSFSLFYGDTHALEYTLGDLGNLLLALETAGTASFWPQLSNHVDTVSYEATDLFSNTAPRDTHTTADAGGDAHEPVPINVAAVIKRNQDRRYRGGKSHVYIAGYPDLHRASDSLWNSAAITNLAAGVAAFDTAAHTVTSSHGDPFVPIAVSRFTGHAERGSPVLFHIVSTTPEIRICTRRRRLPKIS